MSDDMKTLEPQPAQESQIPVSLIVGDRLCEHCGYNLTGQSIFRESHYKLLIARCPECGSVTALQDYPSLGKWANRWAGFFAAFWLLLLLAIWAGSSGAIFGISMGTTYSVSQGSFRTYIQEQYSIWEAEQEAISAAATGQSNPKPATNSNATTQALNQAIIMPPGTPQRVQTFISGRGMYANFNTWWVLQDKSALLTQAGGWGKAINQQTYLFLTLATFIAFSFGCFWGVALLKQKWRGLLIWSAIIIATSGVFSIFALTDIFESAARYPRAAAQQVITPTILPAMLVFSFLPLALGATLGRPIARKLTQLLLPPRLLNSVSTLWITDGLKPPSASCAK